MLARIQLLRFQASAAPSSTALGLRVQLTWHLHLANEAHSSLLHLPSLPAERLPFSAPYWPHGRAEGPYPLDNSVRLDGARTPTSEGRQRPAAATRHSPCMGVISQWAAFRQMTRGETTPMRSGSRLAACQFAIR